ncbi:MULTISPECIES: hypothetical protein [unclassified Polynucleobacter]|jgi:hypothetical protein|uniref:hypothetical protein n=1 Tax=unclassified Polynucleobacter TaxID=2640945 RepID=UPI001C0C44A3|nr:MULTISPECIES: hypothetical protein [unclassified Polynucleobacter]MBU3537926.1 hypothetical protein [Polynucleobacter sp. UK-Gri1-W3]MEA9567141.1 hypothetical protein [Polynucleobacter sp. AP-Nickl1-40-C4]
MTDLQKKTKPSLESLLATSQVVTGKQVIEMQKAKAKQLEEFAQAMEFEMRNKMSGKLK